MKNSIYILAIALMVALCNKPHNIRGSKARANKAKMQRFYDEVINAHNTAVIDSFCTAEFVDHNPQPPHTGKGTDDLKATFNELFTAYPDLHVATNFMIAQGDTVMAYITMAGTNTGMMGDKPATNKKVSFEGMDAVSIKDGKAVERWGVFDNMTMMMQLGMMPAPGAMPDSGMKKMDIGKNN